MPYIPPPSFTISHSTWQPSTCRLNSGIEILGQSTSDMTPFSAPENCVTIGTGLPPVPTELVSRIEVGGYIDMREFLPDWLGTTRSPAINDLFKTGCQWRRASSEILPVFCNLHGNMLQKASSVYSWPARLSNSDRWSFIGVSGDG